MSKIVEDIIKGIDNPKIVESFLTAWNHINNPEYTKIACSISGGGDSDIVLDICTKVDVDHKIDYIFFDTGVEYQASKDHLDYLENRYGIKIERIKAKTPVPLACKNYGLPFLSKWVSQNIGYLQNYNFQFEDEPYEKLVQKYCKWDDTKQEYRGCKFALKWWCNKADSAEYSAQCTKSFNINRNQYLKEFLIQNPPTFKISAKCCTCAKKNTSRDLIKERDYQMMIIGVRKAEGGIRSVAYRSCFHTKNNIAYYRPIFWYLKADKQEYEKLFNIEHSKCYTEYRMDRTGCAGCPFNPHLESELEVLNKYEPKLYKAANYIFHDSYEYTRKYRQFVAKMKAKERQKCLTS